VFRYIINAIRHYLRNPNTGGDKMNIVDEIKRDEGLRLKPYVCTAGKLTIGYGRNLEGRGITEQEAEYLLANDLLLIKSQLKKEVEFFESLDEERQAALINMGFNLGITGLLKFKKMLKALEIGNYERAALEASDSRWYRQVGQRAVRIVAKIKGD